METLCRTEQEELEARLEMFVEAIQSTPNLEIIDTYSISDTRYADDAFVLRNHNVPEGIEGAYIEVSISEIIEKVSSHEKAVEYIKVLNNEREPIILHGITRIVGYYSRIHNWLPSKIGELRDRVKSRGNGGYILEGKRPIFQKEALSYVEEISRIN